MIKPQGLWFGRERARAFGMVHEPASPSTRGVVFCNSLGMEGLLAQRSGHQLADELADRGFWVLRLDYDGQGDAAGGAWEPHQVERWIASIDAAVGVLRDRGVTDVQLVGLRVGGALACSYATTHPGISGVVLWWPCVRGAAYVREARALSRLSGAGRPPQREPADWFPADSLEVVGFELSAETMQDLAAIDLVAAPTPVHARAILLLDRDDASPNDDLAAKLEATGSNVEHDCVAGYEDMLTEDARYSVVPAAALKRIEAWLEGTRPPVVAGTVANDAPIVVGPTLTIEESGAGRLAAPDTAVGSFVEATHRIGDHLFAISSKPTADAPNRQACIVVCNTGLISRVGPGRLHVDQSRYWASLGYTVVRVDLLGAGDSSPGDSGADIDANAPARAEELREAIKWTQQWSGFERTAVYGMCSGAFNAFHAINTEVHIDQLMLVNPATFFLGTDQESEDSPAHAISSAQQMSRGLFDTRRWKEALRNPGQLRAGFRRARELSGKNALAGYRVLAAAKVRNAARRVGLPVKAASEQPGEFDELAARGVKLLLVFAAGEDTSTYLRTLGGMEFKALVDSGDIEIVNIDGGDHIFSSPGGRQAMIRVATSHLDRALERAT